MILFQSNENKNKTKTKKPAYQVFTGMILNDNMMNYDETIDIVITTNMVWDDEMGKILRSHFSIKACNFKVGTTRFDDYSIPFCSHKIYVSVMGFIKKNPQLICLFPLRKTEK